MKKISPWTVFVFTVLFGTACLNYALYYFSQIDKPAYVKTKADQSE